MKSIVMTIAGVVLATLFATTVAHAHYLWIEPGDTGARLYFGEADALIKEKSPGKLDSIKAPQAFVSDAASGTSTPITVQRSTEFFLVSTGKGAPAILASEEMLEVRDLTRHGLGIAKSNYYARHGLPGIGSDSSAPLALDVQGNAPNRFTVLYRGHPLKSATIEVIAPNTWTQEHKTDAQGSVAINTPWRGRYVVHVLHIDKTAGEFGGTKYDNLRNHFTYSFIKADGGDPGVAAPPRREID